MLFLFICANIPKIARYKYLIKTKSYNIGFESKIIKLLTLYSRIAQALFLSFSNLPNNSFTSILLSFHRPVASLRCRCKGVYEVLTDVQGRALRFCEKSSLRPCGCEVFVLKNLVRPNLYTEKPLKRNDRRDRKTHQKKNVG